MNDSAALKFEYQVVDIETDQQVMFDADQPCSPSGCFNYGLFNTTFDQLAPQKQVGIASIALDVIF